MFHRPAHEWDKQLRDGLGISLYKGEGSREDLDCYRTIILLPILSRVLGRILSVRIMSFAEEEQLLSGCQWGNRKHRSVQDALFVVRMVTEMAAEVSHVPGACLAVESALVLVFFDIRKAFPSVDRTAAFELFARLGFPQPLLQALDALHSGTSYQACASEGLSQPYKLTAGFREGCSTSPGLYTIFHDFVTQDFAKRLDALRKECPEHFVELRSLWGRRFNRRVNRSNRPRSRMLRNFRFGNSCPSCLLTIPLFCYEKVAERKQNGFWHRRCATGVRSLNQARRSGYSSIPLAQMNEMVFAVMRGCWEEFFPTMGYMPRTMLTDFNVPSAFGATFTSKCLDTAFRRECRAVWWKLQSYGHWFSVPNPGWFRVPLFTSGRLSFTRLHGVYAVSA